MWQGALHWGTAFRHGLLLLAVLVIAAQSEPGAGYRMLAAFVTGAFAATAATVAAVTSLPVGVDYAAAAALGLFAAAGFAVSPLLTVLMGACAGTVAGIAHGSALEGSPWWFAAGVAAGAGVLIVYAIELGSRFKAVWVPIAFRVAGSWIAAVALLAAAAGLSAAQVEPRDLGVGEAHLERSEG